MDEETLESAISELPQVDVGVSESPLWIDLIASSGVVDSKSAARRVVKEGGAYLNNMKVGDEGTMLTEADFLFGRIALLRKGKRDLVAVLRKA